MPTKAKWYEKLAGFAPRGPQDAAQYERVKQEAMLRHIYTTEDAVDDVAEMANRDEYHQGQPGIPEEVRVRKEVHEQKVINPAKAEPINWGRYTQGFVSQSQRNEQPHARLETTPLGGKQSKLEARYDLIPPGVWQAVAELMSVALLTYTEDNPQKITSGDHVNHAIGHVVGWLSTGDIEELIHALARLIFAVEREQKNHA